TLAVALLPCPPCPATPPPDTCTLSLHDALPISPGRISARDRPDSPHALAAGGSTAIQHRISQWILPQRTDQIPTRQQFVDEPRPVTDRTAGRSADGCRSLPSQSSTASRPRRTSSGSAGWTTEVSLSS